MIRNGHSVRPLRKQVVSGNAVGWINDGQEGFFYEVMLDNIKLMEMVRQAAINKGSKAVDGPIQVNISQRKRL
jgi:hypothetical protein